MNISEMSALECSQWLAKNSGLYSWSDSQYEWIDNKTNKGLGTDQNSHQGFGEWPRPIEPYPLTLDWAAKALPETWRLVRLGINEKGETLATIYSKTPNQHLWEEVMAPDRMTAEYRAAVMATMLDQR